MELANIHPRPPAVRVFDAGVGDGTVLARVMRTMHDRFPTMPFYIVGKEISLEDIRLTLHKMADRFVEHPSTVLVLTNLAYAEAPWLAVKSLSAATSLVWKELAMDGNTAHSFEQQITALEPFLAENWKARVSPKSGNPVYERPVILVIYRNDHKFLLDQIVPKPGGTVADYDLVIASQPYRARASLEFKAKRVLAPLARALGPGGRMIAIHSYGHDPGMEIIHKVWPNDNPFVAQPPRPAQGSQARVGRGRPRSQFQRLFRPALAVPLRHAHAAVGNLLLDRHLDAARRLERGDLRGADRGRPPVRRQQRPPLYRGDARRAAEAGRPVVLRRILRDLAPARVSSAMDAATISRSVFRSRRRGRARPRSPRSPRLLPPGTPVYFSAVPTITPQELIAAAALLRKAGLEPVVHIAARRIHAAADLQDLLAGLRGEADVRRLLVIGGDVDASGPFADALAVIQKGRLREAGIEEIGIGAYPEGHRRIPAGRLEAALDEKIAAAAAQGLRVHIVSQFSFSPERILAWLRQLARLRHRQAGEGRHGRPHQHARAAALRQALRRQRLAARPDVGRGGRPHRPCRAGPHRRNAGRGRRSGRCRAALFFVRRGG